MEVFKRILSPSRLKSHREITGVLSQSHRPSLEADSVVMLSFMTRAGGHKQVKDVVAAFRRPTVWVSRQGATSQPSRRHREAGDHQLLLL